FRGAPQPYNPKSQAMGTGFVIDEKGGYLVTNNHVISQAEKIEITIDGKKFKGKLIGADPQTDIGLVKIEGFKKGDIQELKFANLDNIKVGSFAIAIGNPFGLNHTVTFGIVSAKGRSGMNVTEYEDFIQTDAAINPGNSGGPLINTNGEVIGMNTAIFSQSGGYMGIGFAVPSNMIKEITTQLISGNKIQRAMMGVTIQELNDDLREYLNIEKNVEGALIGSVAKGSPAEKGGIQSGDVITSFNNKPVDSVSKLKNVVGFSPFGKKLPVEIIRNGKKMKVEVVLEKEFLMSETESFSSEEVAGELGLTLTTDKNNVTVSKVENGSLAFMAGIMEGDIIIAVNKKKVKNVSEVVNIVNKSKSILFLINRKGREFFVVVNR
ncbi:MAG TPA: Do family serine endopeptidase, partial [bacterium]|nr:Do family serine endopeptidase [bacterium]